MKKSIVLLALTSMLFISCKEEKEKNDSVETTEKQSAMFSGTHQIDIEKSSIKWVGNKLTGSHDGTISLKEGVLDGSDGKIGSGNFVLDMTSITVTDLEGDEKLSLEGHLKGTEKPDAEDHFFNVKKYPTATFKVVGMEENWLVGDLTMKDVTETVKIPVEIAEEDGKFVVTAETFTIDRTIWNVKYGSKSVFDDLGDKYINDEIELSFVLYTK